MEDQTISFKTTVLAKKKRFNLKTHAYFSKDKYEKEFSEKIGFDDEYWGDNYFYDWNTNGEPFKPFNKECYSAPKQSLLQRWLREVHNIRVLIDFETIDDSKTAYTFKIVKYLPEGKNRKKDTWDFYDTTYSFNQGGGWYKTYEEALELGLIEGLKLIK